MIEALSRIGLSRRFIQRLFAGAAVSAAVLLPCETENAIANGDTRTISFYHAHTKESITATFMVDGSYDQSVLEKLNWFLRDWRRDEPTKMDPRLFDTIWEVYRESGSRQPIEVMSAYRSPQTNAMLRRRSRAVAEHSQHILGKAMDQHYMDVPMSRIREIAMRLQHGGVGFYPTAGTPFVHMDVGGVRHWPRMSYDQLARLFPDGKTVHIPSNGQPLPGYELARAELESRGGESYPTASAVKSKGFFAWLFGGGDDDEDLAESGTRPAPRSQPAPQRVAMADRGSGSGSVAQYDTNSRDGGVRSFFTSQQNDPAPAPTPFGGVAREAPAPAPVSQAQSDGLPPVAVPSQTIQQDVSPNIRPATPAPLAQSASTRALADLAAPEQMLMSNGLAVPMPPRRPVELADLGADLPLPPVRPAELSRPIEAAAPTPRTTRPNGLAVVADRRQAFPALITQGSNAGKPVTPSQVLAYAGGTGLTNVPLPVARPADLVQARLDRSNFRNLTSSTRTEKTQARAVLGSTIIGVRAASKSVAPTLATAGSAPTRFGNQASELATDRFTGVAVKPAERLVTARRAEASKSKDD